MTTGWILEKRNSLNSARGHAEGLETLISNVRGLSQPLRLYAFSAAEAMVGHRFQF